MGEQAAWLADPCGRHELRYWDGTGWTEHVSDAGATATDPVGDPPPPPPPPGVPSPAAPAGKGGSWKDRLKQAAQQAVEQGKELGDKAKAAVAEQQAKRAEAAAADPNTVWVGQRKSATASVGIGAQTYRLTKDSLYVEGGTLGVSSNQVPLWSVRDVDVRQNLMQQGKNVGDVVVHLDRGFAYGEPQVVLDNIEGPYEVRDLINSLVRDARALRASGATFAGAPPAVTAPAARDLAEELRKLAELRDEGILTEEEFAAQKQRLLGD